MCPGQPDPPQSRSCPCRQARRASGAPLMKLEHCVPGSGREAWYIGHSAWQVTVLWSLHCGRCGQENNGSKMFMTESPKPVSV